MLSPKVDVYSYGILLLELLTGKRPVDPSFGDPMHIAAWVRGMVKERSANLGEAVLDPVLLLGTSDLQKSQMLRVLRTAVLCTKENPNDRPSMAAVVEMLRTSGFPQPQASQQPQVTPR
jgi:serine/threonine protein kinase